MPVAVIEDLSRRIHASEDIRRYCLGGNATFTLRSVKSGKRFTYRMRKPVKGDITFVSLMTGPDNEGDFTYLGVVASQGFQATGKSHNLKESAPFKAFELFWNRALAENTLTPLLEFWHSGRCGRCGRKLTVPESIALGIGPECASKM